MNDWVANLSDALKPLRNATLLTVAAISLVVGAILVPVPIIPGWPLLLFGSYCLSQVFQPEVHA
ncbi:hypothetical protein DO97_20595 [Neosynechococcus sphagnicola sy1]|uniref:Uncharacterized protein n=1 Tax=Neosynechococcus sphagnicola sy1 TaxID=1497020 RepID=A0A098TKQ6_9CYAN|nr:hypothetical protein [Neosynechococcus sphagnicola]KGF71418.1 hypothetical protein DO97_20595 [Neosynechococcus sphagnicola sy1]